MKAKKCFSLVMLLIIAMTVYAGDKKNSYSGEEDFISNETWKPDESGNLLTVDFTVKLSSGESKGTYYFMKSE